MAQDTREGLGVHSGGQSVGGKCMPQIVESDARQSGLKKLLIYFSFMELAKASITMMLWKMQ